MISVRKFYKTTFKVEILSEERIPEDMTLDAVLIEATDGGYSGDVHRDSEEEVDAPTMAKLLQDQNSDPSFFHLTENGEEVSE